MPTQVPVVPSLNTLEDAHEVPKVLNPIKLGIHWLNRTITSIPQHSVGWLVANGWRITQTVVDNTTIPATFAYNMETDQLNPETIVLALLNSYTAEANNARTANNDRYAEIISNWGDMVSSSQTHFKAETSQQNACLGVYLADLNALDDIDELLTTNSDSFDQKYNNHEATAIGRLDGLGSTELARITEQFAASLSVQQQQLIDSGLYNSAVNTDITARNTRDRDEQVQLLNDRLNREKLANDHQLFGQFSGLKQFKLQSALSQMNVKVTQLEGRKRIHEDNMKLMAYQLETRNNLLVGLYAFAERREDIAPEWDKMTTVMAALGEAGGGSWIQP